MNAAVVKERAAVPNLKDSKLFRQDAYIDGAWAEADSRARFEVHNPADGSLLGSVPNMGPMETQRAIAAAEAALPAWRAFTAKERSKILRKWFDLIIANADDLALILTTEQGKPLAESKGEILYGASFVEWFAEEAKRVYGDVIPTPSNDRRIITIKQPIGVVAAITPWNFPTAMITRKVAPGLAVGCTIRPEARGANAVGALALAELAERAGMPKGVLNIITGDPAPIGEELCASPVVRKVTFTGSTEVGRILMRQSADTIKKLSLELGGNAPFIVFDDADLDAAAEGACFEVPQRRADLRVRQPHLRAGLGLRRIRGEVGREGEEIQGGPWHGRGRDHRAAHRQAGTGEGRGARGRRNKQGCQGGDGWQAPLAGQPFLRYTLLTEVTPEMKVSREETFGPVAPLYRFKKDDDAVKLANNTEFGLAAYFYARDVGRVFRIAEAIESGMVGINVGILANEVSPFGGVKQSGLGREGSKYGIDDFLEIKYLAIGGIQ